CQAGCQRKGAESVNGGGVTKQPAPIGTPQEDFLHVQGRIGGESAQKTRPEQRVPNGIIGSRLRSGEQTGAKRTERVHQQRGVKRAAVPGGHPSPDGVSEQGTRSASRADRGQNPQRHEDSPFFRDRMPFSPRRTPYQAK